MASRFLEVDKSSITENTSQNKPQNVNPQNNLPSEIVQKGRFCCWRYEERDGRKTKVPYNPLTGQMARSNDAGSFTDFKIASRATGYDGIGVGIFNGICAIDLDHCVTDSGFYSGAAAEIVSLMHSYTDLVELRSDCPSSAPTDVSGAVVFSFTVIISTSRNELQVHIFIP